MKASCFSSAAALCVVLRCGPLLAQSDVVWDVGAAGLFDRTDQAYQIESGRVAVDLGAETVACPTGLGQMASGREAVEEIRLRFEAQSAGQHWLHVGWQPGGSGEEQFEVACNGAHLGKSALVDATKRPYQPIAERFEVTINSGENELVLHRLSGDGLHFVNLVLSRSDAPPAPVKPDLKFPTLQAYEAEIGERGVMLESNHVRLLAPRRMADAAKVIFPYLVKAYDELYRLVGVHTPYKIVVYHFPDDSPNAWGGTSECTIWYGYKNLDLQSDPEWQRYRVPHVCGYIEEMAHNFVAVTDAQFGWEMIGWSIGTRVTQKIANNPIVQRHVQDARRVQAQTFARYVNGGYVFPRDIPANLCDRIHAYLLWRAEEKYGPTFWPDFFREIGKKRERLAAIPPGDADQRRNRRYQITLDCFDRLPGLSFKQVLKMHHISLTTDVKSLRPTDPDWDRRFVPRTPESR